MNKGTNASLRAMIIVLLITLSVISVMPTAMAYDHGQTYDWNAAYFVEEDIRSPDCGTETVSIWVNVSTLTKTGRTVFVYDSTCANVTSVTLNPNWVQYGDYNLMPGRAVVSYGATAAYGPGPVHIADFTIKCNKSLSCPDCCCGTNLTWETTGGYYSYLEDDGGSPITPVNWANGTFLCCDGIDVEKTAWDESTSSWVDPLTLTSTGMGKDVIFNITVTAKCLDLSNLMVFDVMATGLQYNNNATPPTVDNTTHTVNWTTLGSLAAGASTSIYFNATIAEYGPQVNTATATATVDSLPGVVVQASDTATVDTSPPAGIEVNKTVWNGSAWVDLINGATIGNTYRFRCEVTNTGSPGMDVCEITVWDELPAGLSYANNAKLYDHYGVEWDLTDPPCINDPANNTYGWIIDNRLTIPECLQPVHQNIVIEYDVTVTNYGLSCNNMTAEANCSAAAPANWVYDSDDACIDVPMPDLNVTAGNSIKVNPDVPYLCDMAFGPTDHPGKQTQSNNISAEVKECNGVAIIIPFEVTINVTNSTSGDVVATRTTTLPGLAGGTEVTVWCNNSWYPTAGWNYTINVTADPADAIPETDEGNNTLLRDVTPHIYGWKGNSYQDGRNITTFQYHNGTVNLVYSVNDTYQSGGATPLWTDIDRIFPAGDFSAIPTTDTSIKKARLYVYYTWDKTPGQNITNYLTLDFNGYTLPQDAVYIDRKAPDIDVSDLRPGGPPGYNVTKSNCAYGMIAYDVTHKFKLDGSDNIADLHNSGGIASINGMLLVVVYENPNEPERVIWINEGFDMLKSGLTKYVYSPATYGPTGITPEEATAYAPFTGYGPIGSDNSKATLIAVATGGSAGAANEQTTGHSLYFNGEEIGKDYVWNSYKVRANETNIPLSLLQSTDNTVAFRSYGDGFEAANAFLIVQKAIPMMSVEPEPPASGLCYDVGEEFDVLIKIDPIGVPIRGAQFDLNYNGSEVMVDNFELGGFLDPPVSIDHQSIDNAAGVASFAASMTSGTDGMTDPGTFVIVRCMAVGQGANSSLTLTDAVAYDNTTPIMQEVLVDTYNSSVEVCDNTRPIPVAMSKFTHNNMADIIVTKAYFDGTDSTDPDGIVTMYEWWFGDGATGVGPTPEHAFDVRQYWVGVDASGHYIPANVTLIVIDDGMPLMDNMTHIDVTVWIGGDANGDGRVNIGDSVMVGYYWGSTCNTNGDGLRWWDNLPADMADLNNDEKVNIGDSIPVGYCWGHTAW